MNLFGQKVRQIQERQNGHNKGRTWKDIGAAAGLIPSEVTYILNGNLRKVEKVQDLIDALATSQDEVDELAIAWLTDRLLELERGQDRIIIKRTDEPDAILPRQMLAQLPLEVREAFETLLNDALANDAVHPLLIGAAQNIERRYQIPKSVPGEEPQAAEDAGSYDAKNSPSP